MSTEPTSRPVSPSRAEAAARTGASAAQREPARSGGFLAALQAVSPDNADLSGAASGSGLRGAGAEDDDGGPGRTAKGRRRGALRDAADATHAADTAPTGEGSPLLEASSPLARTGAWASPPALPSGQLGDAGQPAAGLSLDTGSTLTDPSAPGAAPRGAAGGTLGWTAAAARRAVRSIDDGGGAGRSVASADRAHRAQTPGGAADAPDNGQASAAQGPLSATGPSAGAPLANGVHPLATLFAERVAQGESDAESGSAAGGIVATDGVPGGASRSPRSGAGDTGAGSGGQGYTAAGLPDGSGAVDPGNAPAIDTQAFAESLLSQGDVQQIADQVSLWLSQGVSEAELRIERLGEERMDVRIELDGARADIAFHTDALDAREAMQRSLAELEAMLRQEGLTLGSMSVGDQASRQRDPSRSGASRPGPLALKGTPGELAQRIATPAAGGLQTGRGRLDLYV